MVNKLYNIVDEETTMQTPLETETPNANGIPTPISYGTPHTTTTNKLVGNTFFGPDFNLDTFRGKLIINMIEFIIRMKQQQVSKRLLSKVTFLIQKVEFHSSDCIIYAKT